MTTDKIERLDANPVSRLDTLRDTRPDLWEQTPAAFCELLEDFKTWLLRLQEERGTEQAKREHAEARLGLIEKTLEINQDNVMELRAEVDALLEALKAQVENWRDRVEREDAIHRANPYGLGGSYSRPIEACIDDIEDIIANVEGKDG